MISGERQMVRQKDARWPCGVCSKGVGRYSRLQPTSNNTFSAVLLRCGVTEIGRKWEKPMGADTLGTGVTNALSQ